VKKSASVTKTGVKLGSDILCPAQRNPTFTPKTKEKHPKSYDFGCDLVAGMGFEPHDLRVMRDTLVYVCKMNDVRGGKKGSIGAKNITKRRSVLTRANSMKLGWGQIGVRIKFVRIKRAFL